MPTTQELLAKAKSQLTQIQATKDAISKSGGFTEAGLSKATNSLKTANQNLSSSATKAGYKVPAPTPTAPTVPAPTVPQPNLTPTQRAGNFANLSAALQNAINLGRAQRQSAELDFLGGVIEPGAVNASTFTGLLANLNQASNKFTEPLTESVLDFARDEQDAVRQQQNDIRDLALAMVENGASQESVNGVLNAGDLNSAISMAAGALNTGSKEQIKQIGSNLVAYDEEGNVRVLFSSKTGGGGGTNSSTVPPSPDSSGGTDFMTMTIANVKLKAQSMFAPAFATKLINELNDDQLRLFLNDYTQTMNMERMSIDPETYFMEWKAEAGVGSSSQSSGTTNPFRKN